LLFQNCYDLFEFACVLWIMAFSVLFLAFLLFLLASKKSDIESRKNVLIGYGMFCLLFGLTRFFFYISDFFGDFHDTIIVLGYGTGILGLISVIFILETYLIKTKKVLTIITSICFLIMIFAILGLTTRDVALTMIYILSPAALIAATIAYIYFIKNSTGASRKKAIGALLGIFLIFFGHFMDSNLWTSLFDTPIIISPIVLIFGVLFFTSSQLYGRSN